MCDNYNKVVKSGLKVGDTVAFSHLDGTMVAQVTIGSFHYGNPLYVVRINYSGRKDYPATFAEITKVETERENVVNRLYGTRCYLAGPMDRVPDGGVIWRKN